MPKGVEESSRTPELDRLGKDYGEYAEFEDGKMVYHEIRKRPGCPLFWFAWVLFAVQQVRELWNRMVSKS